MCELVFHFFLICKLNTALVFESQTHVFLTQQEKAVAVTTEMCWDILIFIQLDYKLLLICMSFKLPWHLLSQNPKHNQCLLVKVLSPFWNLCFLQYEQTKWTAEVLRSAQDHTELMAELVWSELLSYPGSALTTAPHTRSTPHACCTHSKQGINKNRFSG